MTKRTPAAMPMVTATPATAAMPEGSEEGEQEAEATRRAERERRAAGFLAHVAWLTDANRGDGRCLWAGRSGCSGTARPVAVPGHAHNAGPARATP